MFVFVFFRTVTDISCIQSQPRTLSSFCLPSDAPFESLPLAAPSVGLNGSWSISFLMFIPFDFSPLLVLLLPGLAFLSYNYNSEVVSKHPVSKL